MPLPLQPPLLALQIAALFLAIAASNPAAAFYDSDDVPVLQRVGIITVPPDGNEIFSKKFTTCFFVKHNDVIALVTAKNMLVHFERAAKIEILNSEKQTRRTTLENISDWSAENPWLSHSKADVALLLLRDSDNSDGFVGEARKIAFPVEALVDGNLAAGDPIDSVGLSATLRPTIYGPSTAVQMRSILCSGEIAVPLEWKMPPSLLSSPICGEGFAGAPVFLASKEQGSRKIIGMHSSSISDNLGARMNVIVPSRYVREMVVEHTATDAK